MSRAAVELSAEDLETNLREQRFTNDVLENRAGAFSEAEEDEDEEDDD